DDGALDVWIRLAADVETSGLTPSAPADGLEREARLTNGVASHAAMRLEVQRVGGREEPFVAIAEVRFEVEIQIDQEALHFDPVEGRGLVTHGTLTAVRRSVYPASVHGRPASKQERAAREREGIVARLSRYLRG